MLFNSLKEERKSFNITQSSINFNLFGCFRSSIQALVSLSKYFVNGENFEISKNLKKKANTNAGEEMKSNEDES
jgi:hypothetical protein